MLDTSPLTHLPVDLLRTFVAAAQTGNYTRAAEQVNRTQSAVSMQMKRLEEEITVPLFERQGREMVLTPQGRTLLEYAHRILALNDEALAAFARPDIQGRIRLGAPDNYATQFLPGILAAFARSHPNIRVDLICHTSEVLRQRQNHDDLDLAICICGQEGDAGQVIHREPVVWAAPRDHSPEKEHPLPLALFHQGCLYRGWTLEALDKAGIQHRVAFCSSSISGVMAAVRSGLAVAPVGASSVGPDCRILGPADGFPLLPVSTVTLHGGTDPAQAPAHCLAHHITEAFGSITAPTQ